MADLTDDQLDDLERVARAGSPGPFEAAFSYREPGNVLALLAAVRRGRRIEAAADSVACSCKHDCMSDHGNYLTVEDCPFGILAAALDGA